MLKRAKPVSAYAKSAVMVHNRELILPHGFLVFWWDHTDLLCFCLSTLVGPMYTTVGLAYKARRRWKIF